MDENKDHGQTNGRPVDKEKPETVEKADRKPDQPDKAEDVNQAEIPVKQLPMDGICGGY